MFVFTAKQIYFSARWFLYTYGRQCQNCSTYHLLCVHLAENMLQGI